MTLLSQLGLPGSCFDANVHGGDEGYPEFPAPNGPHSDVPFKCEYPKLKDWSSCSTPDNRECWLRGNIHTNYDAVWPEGITREYFLEVDQKNINADGINNPDGKACWGDEIKLTVKNRLEFNGTTVHWHGFRQWNTTEMDGVNGVTQCPIAPEDSYIYTFRATQYGTSCDPLIITNWNHRSAFKDWQKELVPKPDFPKMNSGKKYLLGIINTSVDITYIFSIDNHEFTVMTTEFFGLLTLLVCLGQRYHVVLTATPNVIDDSTPPDNYWIRVIPADGCKGFETGNEPDERQGILEYDAKNIGVPSTVRGNFPKACRDEHYDILTPIVPWKIEPIELSALASSQFDVGKKTRPSRPLPVDNFSWWALGEDPLWLDFADPTILSLGNTTWNKDHVVVSKNGTAETWVYLVVTGPPPKALLALNKRYQMHLHGHDFALLAQGTNTSELQNDQLKFDNPPRRDVVLLPTEGYIVIAFKADNPGSWLFHCHIPWHASSGLALQILERQDDLRSQIGSRPK
ncbi:multicopper oxidase-domain-containing protein [Lasiosphaeris hirsuta]|uniref:Multicopper oxidase-domain-containing protein n=1 Tax=Lasiosphaeris hirsuta TaxID=260670 RepID=A0AA40DG28_9PEZI|nr:multicopper oxidase-domain-containing protein [Lasiosphaeris hirsuta]